LRLNSSTNILTVRNLDEISYPQSLLVVSLCLKSNSLIPLLHSLTDYRRKSGNFKHTLPEILFLVFSAVLSGYDDWQSIVLFGSYQKEWLQLYFPYKNGIPSHDTIERLFALIDTKEMDTLLGKLFELLLQNELVDHIAIDGKRICGSYNTANDTPALHMLSAFATQHGIVIGQKQTDKKSNEIKAIPQLIEYLDIKGGLVSIDAIGCQKEIAKQIIDKRGDYLFGLKKNQKTLYEEVEQAFLSQNPLDTHIQNDFGHGRIEKRTCSIIRDMKFVDESENWTGLTTLIRIESERHDKAKNNDESEIRYYMSSKTDNAEAFNRYVRDHWKIENNLHYMLDVVFDEDQKRKRKGNSAYNMNTVYKTVLPILKKDPLKASIQNKRGVAALDPCYRSFLLCF
jgi:predicted transposase YbfD/YdcC